MIPLDLNWNSANEPGLPSKWKLLIRNGDLNRDCRAGCFKQRSPEHLSFKHFFFASIHWLAQLDLHLPNAYFVP